MMSQGINVVLAKNLLSIEYKQSQAIVEIDAACVEKMHKMKLEYDEKVENQGNEIQLLHGEIQKLKELIFGNQVCEVGVNLRRTERVEHCVYSVLDTEPTNQNLDRLELKRTVQETKEKVQELEEITSTLQDFVEDFVKLYEHRNGVVDYVVTKHENDLKTSRDAICVVGDQVESYSKQMSWMKCQFMQHIEMLPMKLEGHVEDLKKSMETYVSVDELNQLRRNLEDQIMECDIKCDHIVLTARQHWEEYKRQIGRAHV